MSTMDSFVWYKAIQWVPGTTSPVIKLSSGYQRPFAGDEAIQRVPGTPSPEVKRPRREANHSPLSSADVKNAWNYTFISPNVFMAWCLIKRRDTFTFTLPIKVLNILGQYSLSSNRLGQFLRLFK
jgi:hypothetical protein